jgi:putative DNA primase/helicase
VGNHRLGLLISTAFTGPLLEITAEPSGGIHLFGQSQIGKTVALASAASVWGKADMSGVIRSWRATANGLKALPHKPPMLSWP